MELHDAEESKGITKILAHDIRMKKKSTNQGGHSLDCGFLWSYAGPKSNLHPRTEIPSLTQKLSTFCYVFKYFVFTDLKKNAYFDRKFIKF